MRLTLLSGLLALSLVSCKAKTDTAATSQDSNTIPPQPQPTLQATPEPAGLPKLSPGKHGDTVATASGLMYIDQKVGTGAQPKQGQTITVNYTGTLMTGKPFDSNVDPNFHHVEPFSTEIGVGKVIPGWDEGMMSMKVGGKRRLLIPSQLGYGSNGMGDIPPNAPLIFDVELLKVQ